VLVVDDELVLCQVLQEVLEQTGHEVLTAASGPQALGLLASGKVDVVITDLGMDGMSGWELADLIAQHWPGLPVVMMTGWTGEASHDRAAHPNVSAVLAKPTDIDDLAAALARARTGRAGGAGRR
jgi:CheY-like chemotaxis protein